MKMTNTQSGARIDVSAETASAMGAMWVPVDKAAKPAAAKKAAKPDRTSIVARAKELGLKASGKSGALLTAIAAEEKKRADAAVVASAPAEDSAE